ncbi:Fanconi anemia core complex-associated protein 24 isoform X1 [Ranitomeya variabilis]|uniref:Fanconi anemia core complex-associated protein 24 isoform X1 n=1 Tax=Ranitomeya variabilis TaxID=490064 RepID=UPI0040566BA6
MERKRTGAVITRYERDVRPERNPAAPWTVWGSPGPSGVCQGRVGPGKVKLLFEDGLGLVDFHLSHRACVLYISETDLVSGNAFRRRLVRFRKASSLKGVVIAERTRLSDQYFPPVQNFVVLELGMALLPVTSQSEAAQLITHLVQERSKEGGSNPFIGKKRRHLCEAGILQTVQRIPGVGRVKALQLLQYFPSIQQLSNASQKELEAVVGRGIAGNIYSFFTQA